MQAAVSFYAYKETPQNNSTNNKQAFTPSLSQRKKIKIIFLVITTILFIFLLSKCGSTRTNFNITYSERGIEKFLNTVCKNIDGDYAKVIDPNYDSPAGSSCYAAKMEVKLHNSVPENVQMRFFNQNDSDMVSYGKIIFYNSDSKNEFDCRKALTVALEKTLSGSSHVEEYITSYTEIDSYALSLEHLEKQVLAEYWLTNDLKVEIICEHTFSWDWYLYYTITKY